MIIIIKVPPPTLYAVDLKFTYATDFQVDILCKTIQATFDCMRSFFVPVQGTPAATLSADVAFHSSRRTTCAFSAVDKKERIYRDCLIKSPR